MQYAIQLNLRTFKMFFDVVIIMQNSGFLQFAASFLISKVKALETRLFPVSHFIHCNIPNVCIFMSVSLSQRKICAQEKGKTQHANLRKRKRHPFLSFQSQRPSIFSFSRILNSLIGVPIMSHPYNYAYMESTRTPPELITSHRF